jgi:hypothetical protein
MSMLPILSPIGVVPKQKQEVNQEKSVELIKMNPSYLSSNPIVSKPLLSEFSTTAL